jgi:hypothetical protein
LRPAHAAICVWGAGGGHPWKGARSDPASRHGGLATLCPAQAGRSALHAHPEVYCHGGHVCCLAGCATGHPCLARVPGGPCASASAASPVASRCAFCMCPHRSACVHTTLPVSTPLCMCPCMFIARGMETQPTPCSMRASILWHVWGRFESRLTDCWCRHSRPRLLCLAAVFVGWKDAASLRSSLSVRLEMVSSRQRKALVRDMIASWRVALHNERQVYRGRCVCEHVCTASVHPFPPARHRTAFAWVAHLLPTIPIPCREPLLPPRDSTFPPGVILVGG